ncbi:type II toxin-antitoxin system RelE/ParE family toxin [Lonepinella sp. BR2271]|uniref:type II toxin-antitoxin system RelE/ParE family toxin n=1 Tax=Lonepinella sp. BR2271 TaxID=3434550 RepID=UPI003F6DAB55
MNKIKQTTEFKRWFKAVKDPIAKIAITKRIERAMIGNFGDHKSLGGGLYEMRIDTGKGYRVYYTQHGEIIYILLNGGDKSKQQADIDKAKVILADIKTGKLII